ncbi:MAG: hypothetical protein ACM3MF_10770 [Anaerolineae bacterium]
MSLPSILFGLVYALLLGSVFHVWRDGGAGRLLFFLALSVAGAAAGQWVAMLTQWTAIPIGGLYLGPITLGSLLFLGLGAWLSLVEMRSDDGGKHKV